MSNEELIKQVKQYLEESTQKNSIVTQFSEDVISLAYEKLSLGVQELISNEEDPMVISEILQNFLNTTKMIEDKRIPEQQTMLKWFEQLNKYEQSRYY